MGRWLQVSKGREGREGGEEKGRKEDGNRREGERLVGGYRYRKLGKEGKERGREERRKEEGNGREEGVREEGREKNGLVVRYREGREG